MSNKRLANLKKLFNDNCPPRFCCPNNNNREVQNHDVESNNFGSYDQNSQGNLFPVYSNTRERESSRQNERAAERRAAINAKRIEIQEKTQQLEKERKLQTDRLREDKNDHLQELAVKNASIHTMREEINSMKSRRDDKKLVKSVTIANLKIAFGV